jgi:hypothetical protein
MNVLGMLGIVGFAGLGATLGCHASGPQSPKAGAPITATANTGLESSEAVARAYAKELNEGTLEAALALYPTDAMVEPMVTCTAGAHPLKLQLETQRKQLTEEFAKIQHGIHEAKLVIKYAHAAEPTVRKKGEVEGSCTLQADFEAQAEILQFDEQSTMRLLVVKLAGRWYLFDAPK